MTPLEYLAKFAAGIFTPDLAKTLLETFLGKHPELRKPPLAPENESIDSYVDAYMKAKYHDDLSK